MKSIFTAIVLAAVVLTGCNTMRGMGQDVSHAGHTVSDAASYSR